MTVEGWKLNYLFKEDQIKFETFLMEVPAAFDLPGEQYEGLNGDASEDFLIVKWLAGDTHNAQSVFVCIAKDNSWLFCRTAKRCFAVSVDGGMSPEDIWNKVTSVVTFYD